MRGQGNRNHPGLALCRSRQLSPEPFRVIKSVSRCGRPDWESDSQPQYFVAGSFKGGLCLPRFSGQPNKTPHNIWPEK
jgi:hypothetical protein